MLLLASVHAPDAALQRWVRSVPAVRCAAPAFRAWIPAQDGDTVPVTPVSGERFAATLFSEQGGSGLTKAGGGPRDTTYYVARLPSATALELYAQEQEGTFIALVPAPSLPPPRVVSVLPATPRAHGLTLASTRTEVERVLGPGRTKTLCGYEVVRYEPRPPAASVAEMWFFYRNGRVAAIARYEAV